MAYSYLIIEMDGDIAVVSINRPAALNALNDAVVNELNACFDELEKDSRVKVIILTGSGEKAFVSGADIGELSLLDCIGGVKTARKGQLLLFKIENLEKPVIAAVNGFALGGGCELAMACDIRIASENAKLGQPEVNLGIIPGYGGTQRLQRLVGKGKAKELIFTGDIIPASEAYRIGLVDKVVPQVELIKSAKEMARKIAEKGPVAIRLAKKSINFGAEVDLWSGCDFEAQQFGIIATTEDKVEGTKAFLEKRKPEFKGK